MASSQESIIPVSNFLSIPLEIRLIIYETYLSDHQRVLRNCQPSNAHICVLHTCRQIAYEARPLFSQFISFRYEHEIAAFTAQTNDFSHVLWADVANDGRLARAHDTGQSVPISQLFLALRKLPCLRRLRVFDCRRGLPVGDLIPGTRLHWQFEEAMFPYGSPCAGLLRYDLFLDSTTRNTAFHTIQPGSLQTLRLSGNCRPQKGVTTPALRHLAMYRVTGNYFDQQQIHDCFAQSSLESFAFVEEKMGYEIRDRDLASLASNFGNRLKKLVLLGCSRLSTTALTSCLSQLLVLDYFSLSFIKTTHELRSNFLEALPSTVSIFRVQITNAWWSDPRVTSMEKDLCNTLEEILHRQPSLLVISVDFREELMGDERRNRWLAIAETARIRLEIGKWWKEEVVEV